MRCLCLIVFQILLFDVFGPHGVLSMSSQMSCWKKEKFEIVESCHQCSSQEHSIHKQCQETGLIEKVNCKSSGYDFKSCVKHSIEDDSHSFWLFEAAMIVSSVLTGFLVIIRMRKLDRDNAERIQRQISAL